VIADDEPGIRSLVKMTLESEAYEILEASTGPQALEKTRQHRPELLLLDIAMPGLSGLEVCRAIKQDPDLNGVKVIMLTAKAQKADILEGERAGADDYFTKPFSPVALLRMVQEVFDGGGS
jgi:CheY-like chemotaxis protein